MLHTCQSRRRWQRARIGSDTFASPFNQGATVRTSTNRALVLVDIQQEYISDPLEIPYPPVGDSLAQTTSATDAATASGTPIVVVQHTADGDASANNPTTDGFALHPEIEKRRGSGWHAITKQYGSVLAGTDLLAWLQENAVDTITLVGYMTNNCIISSAAAAEEGTHAIAAEVHSDAAGAVTIGNSASRPER